MDDLESSGELVESALKAAALKLTKTFPWLAAKVINEGSNSESTGTFKLAKCPQFEPPSTMVSFKDCSAICPPYRDIVQARGPFTMLDGKILAPGPCKAFPEVYEESELKPARVIAMQANFVKGGLLLDAATQHNFIDGSGLFQCMKLLAKAMRGEEFSELDVTQGNRDRRNLIPLLHSSMPLLDHSHLKGPSSIRAANDQLQSLGSKEPAAWYCFRFSSSKLAELKGRANSDLSCIHSDSSTSFVSSNDALSAFCWKRLSHVRLNRRQKPDDFSKFSRALDARRAMQVPPEYMGQMGYNATNTLTFAELEKMSLGMLSALLRITAKAVNNEYTVRSWATFIAGEPDKSTIMFGGMFDPDTSIRLSSLAHVRLCDVGFGILGKPELVRRPNFLPLESSIYFWSQTEAGDHDVLMCLNEKDVQALKADNDWLTYAEFIG